MKSIMTIQISLLFVLAHILPHHFATLCQVYPSEYAYRNDSVTRDERVTTKCRVYQTGLGSEKYIYCDGTQLRLTDSDLGSEQYSSSDYYVWRVGATNRRLLFTFPKTVNLTTITLHYYSDSVRGLQRIRFYAAPDGYNVWQSPTASFISVDVPAEPPDGESVGPKNVSTNCNFNTTKVLMASLSNGFEFAVSEVEFFTCNGKLIRHTETTTTSGTILTSKPFSERNFLNNTITPDAVNQNNSTVVTVMETLTLNNHTKNNVEIDQNSKTSNIKQLAIALPVVITGAIVVTIVLVIVLVSLLLFHRKRHHNVKTTVELDTTYSTLDRGTKQQIQPQTLDTSAELYDQIQLSPSTGQSEPISKTESKNACTFTSPTISTSDYHITEKQHERATERNSSEYATYAVVDKMKKKKQKLEDSKESQENTSERGTLLKQPGNFKAIDPEESRSDAIEKLKTHQWQRNENLEDMYAVVHKKPKKHEEETPPPIPAYTIESLYTAVQKVKIKKDV